MQLLKQSTASTVYVGPVLDSAGAAVTTAALGDFRLIKNGTAATLTGATVTHDANGYYTVALTTTNTDTTGRLTLAVGNTAMSMSTHRYSVLLASVYDALITNATNATGGLPTATGAIAGLAGTIATTTNITAATGIVLSGVTHTGAVIPTVSTVTNGVTVTTNNDKTGYTASTVSDKTGYSLLATTGLGNQTANITGNLSGSVGSVTGAVGSVTSGVTVSDKTGFKLASDGLALVTAWTVGITGNITGNLSGSVGSVSGAVASVTNPVTLTVAYDAAKTASTQTSVDTLATYVDTEVAAIKAKTDNLPVDPADASDIAASFSTVNSTLATISGYIDTEVSAIKAKTDNLPASPAAVGDIPTTSAIANAVAATQALSRLDSMIESDGAGQFRFDTIALSMAPAGGGGGGGTDWTANERTAIRSILGIPTSGTTPSDPTVGILDEIRDKTALITTGTIASSIPVTASGQIDGPLVIGDDYLSANGRAFAWTVALPSAFVIATSTCKFGMQYQDEDGTYSFNVTGTVTDAGSGNVTLTFDVPKETTGTLGPGWYRWSVEIASASGTEVTRVKSSHNKLVEWVEKQT